MPDPGKYGRKPFNPERRRLVLERYLDPRARLTRAGLPPVAGTADVDRSSKVSAIPMYLNDEIGDCLGPDTRVLTADLRWVPVRTVKVGDQLVGFDEEPRGGRDRCRQFRVTTVERVEPLVKPSYDLRFSDGTELRASFDHMWLRQARPKGSWLKTEDMLVKGKRSSSVAKCFDVWQELDSYDSGYLAAALDGEGCLCFDSVSGRVKTVQFSQRSNVMLEEVERALAGHGFAFARRHQPRSSLSANGYDVLRLLGGRRAVARLLGSVRPRRLLSRFDADRLGQICSDKITLVEKKDVGEQVVIALQTSTRTFIAEGIASHNCTIAGEAHLIGAQSVYAGRPEVLFANSEVQSVYSRVGGYVPGNPSTDNGCEMSDVLADLKQNGINDTAGVNHKCEGYASLGNPADEDLLAQCLDVFGSVYVGFNVQQHMETEFSNGQVWTWQPGDSLVGGHCVVLQRRYPEGSMHGVLEYWTWGARQRADFTWQARAVEEAWVVVTRDWIAANGTSVAGMNLPTLLADMADV